MSLHDILYVWRIRVVNGEVGNLSSVSMENLYPLSPLQRAILNDISTAWHPHSRPRNNPLKKIPWKPPIGTNTWGNLVPVNLKCWFVPFTLQSKRKCSVLVAAQVALLAQGYHKIFLCDIMTDTLHSTFNIPVDGPYNNDIDYTIKKYDLVVVDEASMVSPPTFGVISSTFNCLNLRPIVVFVWDKHQQQPLQTIDGCIFTTTSILL